MPQGGILESLRVAGMATWSPRGPSSLPAPGLLRDPLLLFLHLIDTCFFSPKHGRSLGEP